MYSTMFCTIPHQVILYDILFHEGGGSISISFNRVHLAYPFHYSLFYSAFQRRWCHLRLFQKDFCCIPIPLYHIMFSCIQIERRRWHHHFFQEGELGIPSQNCTIMCYTIRHCTLLHSPFHRWRQHTVLPKSIQYTTFFFTKVRLASHLFQDSELGIPI